MKSFDSQGNEAGPAFVEADPIAIEVRGVEMVAHPPTAGQFALYVKRVRQGGGEAIDAQFRFLASLLDQSDVALLEGMLEDGMDFEVVPNIMNYLLEEWTTRPTERSSAASSSRKTTGSKSTAKPR